MDSNEARRFLASFSCTLPESKIWEKYRKDVNTLINTKDISGFGMWDAIRQTMRAGTIQAGAVKDHYDYLKARGDWERWAPMLRNDDAPQFASSMFFLAHFEDLTGRKIKDVDFIFEFGGGFGVMCAAIHSLGFDKKYMLFDFPELLTIQKYYLEKNGVSSVTLECDVNNIQDMPHDSKNSLCISSHALEETPEELMDKIFLAVRNFDMFLFAIGRGNKIPDPFTKFNFFMESMSKEFPDFSFGHMPIMSLERHYIFYGTRNRE